MEEAASESEFQDWEVLHEYDDTSPQLCSNFPDSNSRVLQVIDGGDSASGSTIWFDYFSLRDHETGANTPLECSSMSEECSIESENLNSGHDTGSENNRNSVKNTSELGSESCEDELNQSHASELESDDAELSGSAKEMDGPVESEDSGEEQSERRGEGLEDSCSNSSAMKSRDGDGVDDISKEDLGGEEDVAVEEVGAEAERRRVVWWRMPFQVLRYFFLRASPVWSLSVAAAFMGILILGRRFYKMKRRTKSLRLKIAVEDKKVLQFVDRAARLNQAFSVVRRVPVVRASPTAWPAMSMR